MEVAYLVANEGRRLVDCDRVSVGVRQGRRARVEAVSGSDIVEKRSNLVVLMRKLFDAVLHWGEKLVYTGTKDDSLPPAVLHALDAYLAESNSKLLVVLPLKDEREKESKKPPRSALMMECFEPAAEPQQLVARLEVVGRHAASALYNAVEHRRIPMRFLWLPLAKLQEGLGGKGRAIGITVLLTLVALGCVFTLVPYPLKMDAKGQLLPITRRQLFVPETGKVVDVHVRPNEEIGEDFNVLPLYSPKVSVESSKLQQGIIGLTKQIDLFEAELREKQRKDASEIMPRLLEAKRDRAVKIAELENLLTGLAPVEGRPGYFYVKSPRFSPEENARRHRYRLANDLELGKPGRWTVLTPELHEHLVGKTFDPSTPLMRLGDEDSGWEVEAKLPQKHLHQIMSAFKRLKVKTLVVDLLVRSDPTRTFKGRLHRDRIGGEAAPVKDDNNEAEPVLTAYISIDDADIPEDQRIPRELLITGTEVLLKVRCGDAALGYSLFYGVWEFFCEKVLFFF
jgi:hypothetical protein